MVYKWTDLSWFYIHPRYEKMAILDDILGKVQYLYMPIEKIEVLGKFYYILPVALWIHLSRACRKIWLSPLIFLHKRGYAEIPLGERPGIFWFRYIQFRQVTRSKGQDSA